MPEPLPSRQSGFATSLDHGAIVRRMHERAIDEIAALIHAKLCGCAAGDGEHPQWCDSLYPVVAERAVLHYQQTMGGIR